MKGLIQDIKKKKELGNISDEFVKKELDQFLRENPISKRFLAGEYTTKSAKYKAIVKGVRARLRKLYGVFRENKNSEKLRSLMDDFFISKDSALVPTMLETHASTRERLKIYSRLYQKIFKVVGKVDTILDLGCGINPLSYSLMGIEAAYYAYDINKEEIDIINDYFKAAKVTGEAKVLDLNDTQKILKLPKADVAFLFKVTDMLDKGKGHKPTEKVITSVPSKFVVVSFPTITMSGKPMNFPRRRWIELLCDRLGYSYKTLQFSTEIFYVIEKK